MMQNRIAIVGAGKRVNETILPAILSLDGRVDLVSIHSRTHHEIALPDGSIMESVTSLDPHYFEQVGLIIVAVNTNAIRGVLNYLEKIPRRANTNLVIDTPPLRLSELRKFNTFKGYKSVCVGEDWVTLSPVKLIQSLVSSDKIGQLETITLDRMSYRYHGLATLRAISGAQWLKSMQAGKEGGQHNEYEIVTGNNIKCRTVQPRDYKNGVLTVTGSKGWISTRSQDLQGNGHVLTFPQEAKGWLQHTKLNGEVQPIDDVEAYMTTLPFDYLKDNSALNRLKIRGYGRLLESIMQGTPQYDIRDGLYDYLAIAALERLGRFYDFALPGGAATSLLRKLVDRYRS